MKSEKSPHPILDAITKKLGEVDSLNAKAADLEKDLQREQAELDKVIESGSVDLTDEKALSQLSQRRARIDLIPGSIAAIRRRAASVEATLQGDIESAAQTINQSVQEALRLKHAQLLAIFGPHWELRDHADQAVRSTTTWRNFEVTCSFLTHGTRVKGLIDVPLAQAAGSILENLPAAQKLLLEIQKSS